jgi:pimeloyl-ACP methyl ester carboxylesterase
VATRELSVITDDGVVLAGEEAEPAPIRPGLAGASTEADAGTERSDPTRSGVGGGGRAPIVLLHGLTATRRYVVMGSRLLERSGYRVIAYDARGHGGSTPAVVAGGGAAGEVAYGYARLARDLEAVLDALEIPRAALAGASMGAHTILRFALDHPERVTALGLVTPGFDPAAHLDVPGSPGGAGDKPTRTVIGRAGSDNDRDRSPGTRAFGAGRFGDASGASVFPIGPRFDPLARALREGGVQAFARAYDFSTVPPAWRDTVERVVLQRLSLHEHPAAVADAMEVVSRSRPFEDFAELGAIAVPTVVVASRDEVDPGHPLALAERYARAIPGATFTVEDGGPPLRSPIAWQGGQLSKVLVELLRHVRYT